MPGWNRGTCSMPVNNSAAVLAKPKQCPPAIESFALAIHCWAARVRVHVPRGLALHAYPFAHQRTHRVRIKIPWAGERGAEHRIVEESGTPVLKS